jgi:DNA-binding NarL/FixJ family response regulator
VAAARGELDEALSHLDRAAELFRETLPMPFERARTLLVRGQVQRRAGRRRAAREDVGAALAVFRSLGAGAWASRATEELGRIGGRTAGGSALTVSERVVAELAAAGRSNREIAAELVVSVRTVESQLSAAYRKLDIQSRGQLPAALAVSRGATPS